MSAYPETTTPESWHRYFGVDCNNRAWDLSVRARTAAEDDAMLNLAHAAAYHWGVIGTELHANRAKMLLATVHAALGLAPTAVRYATEVRAFVLAHDSPDWEVALAHAIYAHAVYAAGDRAAHAAAYATAVNALEAITDEEDRGIVQASFDLVPAP